MGHNLGLILRGLGHALCNPRVRALMLLTGALVGVGAVVYRLAEGWRWLDAVYFCVVTLATVGYGDFAPRSDVGKVFTMVLLVCGIGLFVALVTAVAEVIRADAEATGGRK